MTRDIEINQVTVGGLALLSVRVEQLPALAALLEIMTGVEESYGNRDDLDDDTLVVIGAQVVRAYRAHSMGPTDDEPWRGFTARVRDLIQRERDARIVRRPG